MKRNLLFYRATFAVVLAFWAATAWTVASGVHLGRGGAWGAEGALVLASGAFLLAALFPALRGVPPDRRLLAASVAALLAGAALPMMLR